MARLPFTTCRPPSESGGSPILGTPRARRNPQEADSVRSVVIGFGVLGTCGVNSRAERQLEDCRRLQRSEPAVLQFLLTRTGPEYEGRNGGSRPGDRRLPVALGDPGASRQACVAAPCGLAARRACWMAPRSSGSRAGAVPILSRAQYDSRSQSHPRPYLVGAETGTLQTHSSSTAARVGCAPPDRGAGGGTADLPLALRGDGCRGRPCPRERLPALYLGTGAQVGDRPDGRQLPGGEGGAPLRAEALLQPAAVRPPGRPRRRGERGFAVAGSSRAVEFDAALHAALENGAANEE